VVRVLAFEEKRRSLAKNAKSAKKSKKVRGEESRKVRKTGEVGAGIGFFSTGLSFLG
jgi:hypothetical protein